jgi:DNA-binding MarR family transcriptional regulator
MATTSSVSGLAAQLRVAVARTARRLRQEAGTGLSPTLQAAMATVQRHGPLTPSELAVRERVQRPTATKLIARLEAEGLVVRTADPQDRRSSLITSSAEGDEVLRVARTRKDVFLAERLRRLPAEDRATLARAAVLLEGLLEEDERR